MRAEFFSEPSAAAAGDPLGVPAPSFEGKVVRKAPDGTWRDLPRPIPLPPLEGVTSTAIPTAGNDVFIADGSETAVAIAVNDGNRVMATLNLGFTTSPSLLSSADGNGSWTGRTFPNGSGTYTGFPFDPWANAGNADDEFFATLIRRDTGSSNAHVVIARSTDAGVTWPLFFERTKNVFQDREMVDIDRSAALGGGAGTTHDGKVYLTYDDFGPGAVGYVGSFLQVISSAGTALTELSVSTAASFNGSQLEPVAGVNDGQVYLMGLGLASGGATRVLNFHEVTGAGSGLSLNKSFLTFSSTGQQLGATTRWGVNGHRINPQMDMAIDRSNGPQRGALYVVSDRNPNPGNAALDQGDVFLSVSTDGASSWSTTVIPGLTTGKTQFFSMLDVDRDGVIYVAYYQNETGSVNGGVLNASSANLYATLSEDGGATWTPQVQVNDVGNALDYEDPPLDHSASNFYLIGDYAQIKATQTGNLKKAYVFWSGYDKDRSDIFEGDKKDRAIMTNVVHESVVLPPVPATSDMTRLLLATGMLALAARALARRKTYWP